MTSMSSQCFLWRWSGSPLQTRLGYARSQKIWSYVARSLYRQMSFGERSLRVSGLRWYPFEWTQKWVVLKEVLCIRSPVHEYLYFIVSYFLCVTVVYFFVIWSLPSTTYVILCLVSRCRSLCYPTLASLMALVIVLRTLLLLHGQFTPLQTNLSPYEVCASVVRPKTLQSIVPLLNYWLTLSRSEFIIWLCDSIRSL